MPYWAVARERRTTEEMWEDIRRAAEESQAAIEEREPRHLFETAAWADERATCFLDRTVAWHLQKTAEDLLDL